MQKIRIICDSSCDLSIEQAKNINVSIIPLNVNINNQVFKDQIEIDSKTLFEKMEYNNIIPKTSQPSINDFIDEFSKYNSYSDIIYLSLSSKLSGTYNNAKIAVDILKEENPNFNTNIHIIDTLNASASIVVLLNEIIKMINSNEEISCILNKIQDIKNKCKVYFVLDTLKYVKAGGRLSNIKFIVGSLLNVKPILTFREGIVFNYKNTIGLDDSYKELIKIFKNNAYNLNEIFLIHSHARHIDNFIYLIKKNFPTIKINIFHTGAVMGTYAGPNAYGITFIEK